MHATNRTIRIGTAALFLVVLIVPASIGVADAAALDNPGQHSQSRSDLAAPARLSIGAAPALAGLVTQLREVPSGFFESGSGHLDIYHAAPFWSVSRQVLTAHRWVEGYDAVFQRSVASILSRVDRFRSAGDAHQWMRFVSRHLPKSFTKSFHALSPPRIGEERIAYARVAASSSALEADVIVFRRGADVGSITMIYVPHSRQVLATLARAMDGRMK